MNPRCCRPVTWLRIFAQKSSCPLYVTNACSESQSVTTLILTMVSGWRWETNVRPGQIFPGKEPPVRTQQEDGWAPETVRVFSRCKKNLFTLPCSAKAPYVMNTCSEIIRIPCTAHLLLFDDMIHLFTAIGLTPGGSSTAHIYTQTINTQNDKINLVRVRAATRLCELYRGICLTTEEKGRENLSQGSWRMPAGTMERDYYDHQKHNYFTNYHTATCFDTILPSSDSL
jgi:hypothetical protein